MTLPEIRHREPVLEALALAMATSVAFVSFHYALHLHMSLQRDILLGVYGFVYGALQGVISFLSRYCLGAIRLDHYSLSYSVLNANHVRKFGLLLSIGSDCLSLLTFFGTPLMFSHFRIGAIYSLPLAGALIGLTRLYCLWRCAFGLRVKREAISELRALSCRNRSYIQCLVYLKDGSRIDCGTIRSRDIKDVEWWLRKSETDPLVT